MSTNTAGTGQPRLQPLVPSLPTLLFILLAVFLHRQDLPLLQPSPLEYSTSPFGPHPTPEAVHPLATSLLGLIGTLWHRICLLDVKLLWPVSRLVLTKSKGRARWLGL